MKTLKKSLLLLTLIAYPLNVLFSQNTSTDEAMKNANNPLARIKAFNIHNYYLPSLYASDDASATQTLFRYAQPIGNVLVRATLPFETLTPNGDYAEGESKSITTTGLGDFQVFGAWVFSKKGANELAIGPMFVAPTATDTPLGEGKWQAGASFIAFMANNPQFQYGTLLTWQTSFAGDDDREEVSRMVFQPFGMWQIGGGVYLRSSAFWTFDFRNGGINIPFSMGIGNVLKVGKTVFNIFTEPQFSAINYRYNNGAKFQLFTGLNMQFQ